MSQAVKERLSAPGPKRILSLDGGGVMGLITLGYLERIEAILRARQPQERREAFRLCDYFDLIGGTSTGAIIATLLALGMSAEEIKRRYHELCPRVFRGGGLGLIFSKYSARRLNHEIDSAFREVARQAGDADSDFRLESGHLKTGLAIVSKRANTDSVWVQTNVPDRRYWDNATEPWAKTASPFDPNRRYRLKDMVRASAAAPTFLPPVFIRVSAHEQAVFVDGGASPHNNPSKEVFLMAALKGRQPPPDSEESEPPVSPFRLEWDTGADKLLMISIGTGHLENRRRAFSYWWSWSAAQGVSALRSIIHDANQDAVTWMQAISEPTLPWRVDGNLEGMRNLRIVEQPLLSFQRYQADLGRDALRALMGAGWAFWNLSLGGWKRLRTFHSAQKRNLRRLDEVGVKAAERDVDERHLPAAFDI